MKTIIENAKNTQPLHPNADLDPFTHEQLSPQANIESTLRAAKTKSIVTQVEKDAAAEMQQAQKDARDATGADTGCTHELKDQKDYTGVVASTVSGQACVTWVEASPEGSANSSFIPTDFDELFAMRDYCRNPGGGRLGAWCFIKQFPTEDVEGQTWEYCDIGSRCSVDAPILAQVDVQNPVEMSMIGDLPASLPISLSRAFNQNGLRSDASKHSENKRAGRSGIPVSMTA
jgi:hypothetical protein